MNNLKSCLREAGAEVLEIPNNTFDNNPHLGFKNINEYYEKFSDEWETLYTRDKTGIPKPFIAPRDHAITYGNTLHISGLSTTMEHLALKEFKFDKSKVDNQLLSGFRNSPELTKGPFKLSKDWYTDFNKG